MNRHARIQALAARAAGRIGGSGDGTRHREPDADRKRPGRFLHVGDEHRHDHHVDDEHVDDHDDRAQAGPKPKPKAVKRTISCKAKLYATRPPVSTALEFANLSCGTPLGKGVQHNSATVASNAERTSGSFSGNVRLFFNEGALRGTYRTTFSVASGAVAYTGTIKVTSGTGDHKGVKGTGTIRGTSTDGLTATLTEKLTLTFPPAAG